MTLLLQRSIRVPIGTAQGLQNQQPGRGRHLWAVSVCYRIDLDVLAAEREAEAAPIKAPVTADDAHQFFSSDPLSKIFRVSALS